MSLTAAVKAGVASLKYAGKVSGVDADAGVFYYQEAVLFFERNTDVAFLSLLK